MGVSKDAAGLPWKRDTTMERGGCHYLFNENDSSGSGGVRFVWRRVTDENDNVLYGIPQYLGMAEGGVFHFGGRESLRCPAI